MPFPRDTCRRQAETFCKSMGTNNRRPMGFVNNQGRSKIRISDNSSVFRNKTNSCKCPRFTYFTAGGRKIIRKKCHRTCPMARKSERFLFNIFSSSQEIRRAQACYKSPSSKQVSQETAFQNGLFEQCSEPSSARRLGDILRSKRCISSYPNLPLTQEVSSFLHSGKNIPVQFPMFWPNRGPSRLHKGRGSSSGTPQDAEYSSGGLSRRLVSGESNKEITMSGQTNIAQTLSGTRFHDKSRKIFSRTPTVSNVHRGTFFVSKGNGLSNSRAGRQNNCSLHITGESFNSPELSAPIRTHGFLHRTSSQCKTFHETNSTTSPSFLETSDNGVTEGNSIQQASGRASSILDETRKFTERENFLCQKQYKNNNNRCFQVRFRRSHGKSNFSGNLVYAGKGNAHQLVRTESSLPSNQAFSPTFTRSLSVDKIGQHDSCPIYQQTRGNEIPSAVLSGVGFMASGSQEQHVSKISSCGRQPQYTSRQSQQSNNKASRMVTKQCSGAQVVSDLGNSADRPICVRGQSENSSVLHMASQSVGISNRRTINCLGEHGSICFSPNLSPAESSSTHEEISVPVNSRSASMAKEKLVHQSASNVDCLSEETTSQTRSVSSTQNKNLSPRSEGFQLSCMASVNRSIQNKGFSDDTRELMVASWRSGTRKDYAIKFKKFSGWCGRREIDPHAATLTNCADFLTSLFQSGLKYRTISGYRSMLSVMLPPINGISVGQHPDIIRLLKGVFNSRPPVKHLVPEWDLHLVLNILSKAPFEPMHKISLKFLTWKTVFLTAISTFRRCSDIQALRTDIGFMSILPEGIIFVRDGLSKQDRPSHSGKKIFVPCFVKNTKLDPKRAVQIYMKRTAEIRGNSDEGRQFQLFLSINKPHKAVSRQTISSWIVNVIKLAYSDTEINVRAHSTRAIGPSWALFKGASISSILDAADWSSDVTFKKYYYREMHTQDWEF